MRQFLFLLPLLLVPFVWSQSYVLAIFIFGYIIAIQVIGLNIVFGYTGQLSMFQAASFGLGGYFTMLSMQGLGIGFWPALALSTGLLVVVSFLVGSVCLRFGLRAFYFALITLAFAELARLFVLNSDFTGGSAGLIVLKRIPLFGMNVSTPQAWYYFSFAVMTLTLVVSSLIAHSWLGRSLTSIRVNEDLAETIGVDTFKYKMLAFILSNVIGGLSGALYTFYTGFLEPSYLGMPQLLEALLMLLLGGSGTLLGPVVGALFMSALPHLIHLDPIARSMMVGAVLILVILFLPEGIVGRVRRLAGWGRAHA